MVNYLRREKINDTGFDRITLKTLKSTEEIYSLSNLSNWS